MTLLRTLTLAALAAGCSVTPLALATPTTSVADLFNRLPDLPATAQEAAKWVAKDGSIQHPGLIALRADIEAHRKAVQALQFARQPAQQEQNALQVQALDKGMQNVGIDMKRMQSDPAYAREVQARMQRMSPQEAMAMAQQMAQPMNQDRRIVNQAKAQVEDSEAVRAAAAAGYDFGNGQLERSNARLARWSAVDAKVEQMRTAPIAVSVAKPKMEWDNIGCDKACMAAWDAYAAVMVPKMIERDTQVLRVRREGLKQERTILSPLVAEANRHLVATQYATQARANVNQTYIDNLDAMVLGDLVQLLDMTEEAARAGSRSIYCGDQAVRVPGAVCH